MKNFFLKVSLLALVASFFVLPRLANAGTTPATTTSIDNQAPSISAVAESWVQSYTGSSTTDARSESSVTYPTNVGTPVRFTATATDPNGDDWYLAICKTAAITAGSNGAAPTCASSQTWSVSASATASGAPQYVEYTTLDTDAESNNWYAYACDKLASGAGLCSSVSSGSGASGSPFMVNHRPRFNALNTISVAPGTTINFKFANTSAISDPDSNSSQDTVTLYVCTPETTAFDFNLKACTGGLTVCHADAVNPTTTDVACNDGLTPKLNVIPTAHTSYNVKIYVLDPHSFDATKKINNTDAVDTTQSYAVTDVAPFITQSSDYSVTDVSVSAGLGTDKQYTVIIQDNNGDADITAATGVLYHDETIDLSSGTCTGDQNNCYSGVSCSLSNNANYSYGTNTDHGGASAIAATATCNFTVFFNADDTDSETAKWAFHVNPADQLGPVAEDPPFATTYQSAAISVNALQSLNVKETTIAYGTVALNTVSTNTPQTRLQNFGNQTMDVQISGTQMCTDAGVCTTDVTHTPIAQAKQKWSDDSGIDWDSTGYAMLASAGTPAAANGCSDRNMAVRDVSGCSIAACTGGPGDKSEDQTLYWKIKIPGTTVAGSYTGTNTFTMATASTCNGNH
jgi:hypothetical protein